MSSQKPFISIIIPSKNSEKTIEQVLTSIFNQTIRDFEVIVIDSGSKDNTLNILKKFPLRLYQIPPQEFGHGKTRNLGAELARGDILVYLNADAIPLNKWWLEHLIEPLIDSEFAASFSRPIPRPECKPAEKFFIIKTYPPISKTLSYEKLKNDSTSRFVSFSSISGALKKNVWKEFRFRESIVGGEDNDFGLRILHSGLKIKYCAESKVIHSHNFTIKTVFKRYLEYGLTGAETKDKLPSSSTLSWKTIRYFCSLISETLKYAADEDSASAALYALIYTLTKASGYFIGYSSLNMPSQVRNFLITHTLTAFLKKSHPQG